MRVIVVTILWLAVLPIILQAFGWHDYTLPIGEGYHIARANAQDIMLQHDDAFSAIVHPKDTVGPIIGYRMLDAYVLTKNASLVPRNRFEGDPLQEVDLSNLWYFIVPKATNQAIGPLSAESFQKELSKRNIPEGRWQTPRNPNFWLPLLGNLAVLAIIPLFFVARFYYISLPLAALLLWLFCLWRKRR